jgi:signal transduction histidine kinase
LKRDAACGGSELHREETRLGARRILVVHPQSESRDWLVGLLRAWGYHPRACTGVTDTREHLKQQEYDLAFVDSRMSEGKGQCFASSLSKEAPDLDVVLLIDRDDLTNVMSTISDPLRPVLPLPVPSPVAQAITEGILRHRDLKERCRHLEREMARLEELSQRLESLSQFKDDYISTTAHELKTPVTVISEFLAMLQEGILGPLDARQHEALVSMARQFRRVRRLIQGIADLSEVRTSPLDLAPVDLHDLVTEVASELEAEVRARSLQLHIEVQPGAEKIEGDWVRLEQILYHLVSNAVKQSRRDGRVAVALRRKGAEEIIVVEDAGMGIPVEHLNRVFERFHALDQGWTRAFPGAGIGLALVRDYTELHGGTVSACTVPGKGTAFTVTLPITQRRAGLEPAGPGLPLPDARPD